MRFIRCFIGLLIFAISSPALAAASGDTAFKEAFSARYKPCELETPAPGHATYGDPKQETQGLNPLKDSDLSACSTYGVVLKGPIPALTPQYLFTQYHDRVWRRSVLTYPDKLEKGREGVDHWLAPGTVLALHRFEVSPTAIEMRWISVDKLAPSEHPERKPVQIGVTLDFRLPKGWTTAKNEEEILAWLSQWVMPFPTLKKASEYARTAFTGTARPNPIAGDIHTVDLSKPKKPNPIMNDIRVIDLSKPNAKQSGTAPTAPRTLKEGMSVEEVKGLLGEPVDISIIGETTTYAYPDTIVTFKKGKLTDVRFK